MGPFRTLFEEAGQHLPTQERERAADQAAIARGTLNDDDAAFDAAWKEGCALSLEEAVALVGRGARNAG